MAILEKSATAQTSLTNTAYELLDTMTFTSAEVADGDYLAVFTADLDGTSSNNSILNVALFQGGSIVAHTERQLEQESSHDLGVRRTICIIAHVTKTAGQVLEIRWKRDAETWNCQNRVFNLFPAASGDFSDANSATNDTTTNNTYEALNDSLFTNPASGDYLMCFTASVFCPGGEKIAFAVFLDGSIVQHTERVLGGNTSFPNVEETIMMTAKVTVNGSQNVEIRFRRESGTGTHTCMERTSVLLKLGTAVGIVEVSGTVDDSDSTTSDQVIDDLTINNPDSGEYLAIFSGYESEAAPVADVVSHSIFVETTEEADTDRIIEHDSSNDGGDVPVACSGTVNPNGSEDVSAHWQSDSTTTRVIHERTLILLAEFEQTVFPGPIVETTAISNQTSNASSKSDVTSPSGVVNNDIVLIFIAMDGDAANPEANADGFATLTSFPEGADEIYILWKRSTGSEPANYTVNWTGNEQARFMTVRVSGCITTGDPWDVISAGVSGASVDNVINRLTSTVINTLALYGCAVDRDRVDAADTITGTGWTQVGTSGSSGGANGVGLIVGQNDMPTAVQVEAGTFGTWASDQNASRGFNLKPPISGAAFERTAAQTLTESDTVVKLSALSRVGTTVLTHSEAIDRGASTFQRVGATVLVHSEAIDRGASTFERVGTTVLVHSSVIARIKGAIRIVAQALTESDVVDRGASTFERTGTTVLTHSSITAKISELIRTGTTVLVHSETIAQLGVYVRTATQAITHSSVVDRGGSTFERVGTTILVHSEIVVKILANLRTAAQTITHSESIARQLGKLRTATQTITHSDSIVRLLEQSRIVAQNLTHSESIVRILENLRTATTILIHSEVVSRTLGKARTAVQTITHSESIVRLLEQLRVVAQNLTHSSVENREGSTFERTVAQTITESDVVVVVKGLVRTVAQTLIHSETITRILENIRTATQTITHSETIVRILENLRTATTVLVHSSVVVAIKNDVTFIRNVSQNLLHSEIIAQIGGYARTVAQNLLHSSIVTRVSSGDPVGPITPQFGGLRLPKRRIAALMSDGFNKVRIIVRVRDLKREHIIRILNTLYYPYGLGTPVTVIRSLAKSFENKIKIINPIEKSHSTKLEIIIRSMQKEGGKNKANITRRMFSFGAKRLSIKRKVFDKGISDIKVLRHIEKQGSNVVKVKSLAEIIDELEDQDER